MATSIERKNIGTILIVRNAAPQDFGGAERLSVHLSEELKRQGVTAIVASRHKRLLGYAQQRNIEHCRGWWWPKQNWDGRNLLLLPLYLSWQLVLTLWYVQFILHHHISTVHLMSKDDFISGTLAAKMLGRGIIWTDCADLKHIYGNINIWYKNPVGKIVYTVSRLADHVTLVSFSEKRLIEESLKKETPANYTVIHLAGRDEVVTPLRRRAADQGAVVFCATSRLVVAKGILELIDAFRGLARDTSSYRLWLVGDGPDRTLCEERAAHAAYIVFWGHQEKPLEYLAASDVYVHPTHHEAFSLSLAEAAMLGKPMIATNVGGNPELVHKNNGILVPVNDSVALERAMRTLAIDKPLRHQLGKQAREDYVKNFDFQTIVKNKLIPLYEQ